MLDSARGAYAKLPRSVRLPLSHLIRFVPYRVRYGSTYTRWKEAIAAAGASPVEHGARCLETLACVTNHAFNNTEFYRSSIGARFGDAFDARAIVGTPRWAEMPILDAETVTSSRDMLCAVDPSRLHAGSTSGSSGGPVHFYLDADRGPVEYAFVTSAWEAAGLRPQDMRAVFRGMGTAGSTDAPYEVEEALREVRFSIFHLNDDKLRLFWDVMCSRNIAFIIGYPSAIAILASFLLRSGLGPSNRIKGILPISERYYEMQREVIQRAFPAAVHAPFYGLSEKCAFGRELPGEPDVYEFDSLYGYTELVGADGRPVTEPGQEGSIVSTGLIFRGMPFIRYDTRDRATLVRPASAENGYRMRVRAILPRRDSEYFVSSSRAPIPICAAFCATDMIGFGEYQFVQHEPGRATIRVTRSGLSSEADLRGYIASVNAKYPDQLVLDYQIVDQLKMNPRGKRKLIEQNVDDGGVRVRNDALLFG